MGMPTWWVAEPTISLMLDDTPMWSRPSRGPDITVDLTYKGRPGTIGSSDVGESTIFGVGKKWHMPWNAHLEYDPADSTKFWVYSGNGSARKQTLDTFDYGSQTKLVQVCSTNVLQYATGAKDVFGYPITNNTIIRHFLSARLDPFGNVITLVGVYANNTYRLQKIVDVDNHETRFSYITNNAYYSNLVSAVQDDYGHSMILGYDTLGRLTNIVDTVSLTNMLQYDGNDHITNLVTRYGATAFRYLSDATQRGLHVSEHGSRNHFFMYANSITNDGVPTSFGSFVPSTTNTSYFAIANTFDRDDSHERNSYYWGPRQFDALSTTVTNAIWNGTFAITNLFENDLRLARLRHWLLVSDGSAQGITLSLERAPDGNANQGQVTWYDYANKSAAKHEGGSIEPSFIGWKLPNGDSRFSYFERNAWNFPTRVVDTYTGSNGDTQVRTNNFEYAANDIDMVKHLQVLGASSRQVSSNLFNGNHQVLTNFNALNEVTRFTYNNNSQLKTIKTPSGLTVTNIYDDGSLGFSNYLVKTIDLEINRENLFTYSNGLVRTHVNERLLTNTLAWDRLGRLTNISFPDSTSIALTYDRLIWSGSWTGWALPLDGNTTTSGR